MISKLPTNRAKVLSDDKYLKLIKDINLNIVPTAISINSNIIRNYNEQLSRSLVQGLSELPTLTQRRFLFDWNYGASFNLTKSIKLDFRAANNHIYDEFSPSDDVQLFDSFFNIGRPDHYRQALSATYQIPLDKIPFLGFISANYSYTANFDWQASSQSYIDKIGNTIQNANTQALGIDIDFEKLYRSVGLVNLMNSSAPPMQNATGKQTEKKKNKSGASKVGQGFYDLLTSVKKARINYTENNGTFLPGYIPTVGFLGRDNYGGGLAPTFGFVFGSQVDIKQRAVENGWLISRDINDPYYNRTFSNTHLSKLEASVTLRPAPSLDIDLRGNRTYTESISQQLDVINDLQKYIFFSHLFTIKYY